MKYFKHYSNASDSQTLNKIIDEFGLEGYARYWLLLELLAQEFDGTEPIITLHQRQILEKVHIKFGKKLATFMQKLSNFSVLSYEKSGNFYKIEAPILLDLQSKDFKYSRRKRETSSMKATLRYKDKKIKDKKTIQKKFKPPRDRLEEIYAAYPRKQGKSAGFAKLERELKSFQDVEVFATAVEKFAQVMAKENRSQKYIPIFSTFVNSQWRDYLDADVGTVTEASIDLSYLEGSGL